MISDENWDEFGLLQVASRLSVADTSYVFDNPELIYLPSARYSIAVRTIWVQGHGHIASLRLVEPKTVFGRGAKIGEVLIDFAQIGICDRRSVEHAFDLLGNDGMSRYFDQLNTTALTFWVELPGGAKMFVVRTGFGDGSYPIYELPRTDGTRSGVEIEFLPDGA